MCPWGDFTPATIAFCERRLCAWVVEPSNAWSNLAYVLVGVFILWERRGHPRSALDAIGVGVILLGIGSFAFHATGIRVFEVVDVSGMYVLSGIGLTFALQRLLGWRDAVAVACFAGVVLASSLLMVLLGNDGIVVFAIEMTALVLIEVGLRARNPTGAVRWIGRAVAVLVTAYGIWLLDIHGIVCDPDNHLVTGHAVWHVLTAATVLLFYRFQEAVRA